MNMTFRQLNPHSCRTYLVGMEGSDEVVIVDPVLEHLNDYIGLLEHEGARLTHAIDTHTHADHISGCSALKDLTGCEYMMHAKAPARCVTKRVEDGYEFSIGTIPVRVMYTPGHTIDSMSLIFPDRILTGDVLFLDDGGAGRDDLPGGDPAAHWESLQRIRALPDDLVVYPAHEYRNRQPASLGKQKLSNPHLAPKSKEEYITYIEALTLGPAEWMKDVLKANYACARDPKAAWVPVDVPACEVKGTLAHGVNDMEVTGILAADLKGMLDAGVGEKPVLLDVRESKELKGKLGHLPGILHIPIGRLTSHLGEIEKDVRADAEIITICRTGGRAHTAAQILMQAGFGNVGVLEGGMVEWRNRFG